VENVKSIYKCLSAIAIAAAVSTSAAMAAESQQAYPPGLYDGLHWRLVGPFRGGRAVTAVGIPDDPLTYYFGSVAGGVWKTTDAGQSWKPIFDKVPEASIGVIAVAASNPNVIYVGTGERDLRNDYASGAGVYKSVDAGKTWTFMGLKDTQHIAAIIIDSKDSDNVYLAAVGHASGPNSERGVYHTLDGGKTWKNILYVNDKTGAIDLVADPKNPKVMFASMYEAQRKIYDMISGGPGSGLYKTADGGATWTHLQGHGLPGGILGRIGVTISGADSNRVYAQIESKDYDGIYSSDDGGQSWTLVNHDAAWVRPWYQNEIFADPKEKNTLYVLNVGTFVSNDGGKTFRHLSGVAHTDEHYLWIDPNDNHRMIEANDGGATISIDKGVTWTPQNNQPTAQFYHDSTSNEFNYTIYGAQHDSGTVAIKSRTDHGFIGEGDWHAVSGGESGYIFADPRDPNIVYSGSNNGRIALYDGHTGQARNISPTYGGRAHKAADLVHRFQWTAPIEISPHDPNVVYFGGEVVFKTTDRGASWTPISPDLTRNDKSKQQSSPSPLTPDNSSSEYYDTVYAIAESPVRKDMIWAGSDDGLVHLTLDGGKHWNDVTPKALPEWSRIDLIEASPWDPSTAYVAADMHFSDDSRPMIFKTTDAGKSWSLIVDGIAADAYVHSVRADPLRKGLLYAGTEKGIYVSFNDGGNWQSLQMNLPMSPIYDTTVHDNDLIVATHGRAFWILDNIAPIRQADPAIVSQPAHLYNPAIAYRVRTGRARPEPNSAPNPPAGAAIDYYLREARPVVIEITDVNGQVVYHGESLRAVSGNKEPRDAPSAKAGLNRYVWNLRVKPPIKVPGLVMQELNTGGPIVPPGSYTIKLTAGGNTYTAPLILKADPRLKITQTDFDEQYQFAVKLRDRVNEVHGAVIAMQFADARLEAMKRAHAADPAKIDHLEKAIAELEGAFVQVKSVDRWSDLVFPIELGAQYADLMNAVESSDATPTAQAYQFFDLYEKRRTDVMRRWQALQKDLAAIGTFDARWKATELGQPVPAQDETPVEEDRSF
jgi:photosystem II stability/assembly factor-like uncharacterized protein